MIHCLITGKRMINPMVLCLNMLNCTVDEAEQAKIRFQFAVFNADVKHWEYCHVSRTILELKSYTDIISLGYRDLSIADRHLKKNGEVMLMVKIQIIHYESEKHHLSQASTLTTSTYNRNPFKQSLKLILRRILSFTKKELFFKLH